MKEKYENLTDFLNDIVAAAEQASKEVTEDLKKKENVKNTEEKNKGLLESSCLNTLNYKKEPKLYWGALNKEEPCKEQEVVTGNITVTDNNHFCLNEMVNGFPLKYKQQYLQFECIDKDGYKIPGITEGQLLSVLYYRYKDCPKKLNLLRQLMTN